ncbi:MAG: hypothetical protein IGS48_07360 [Oscillatoriales cyanobacterium C42_A2020_001]|nr:hypothetical protein [Leptolyngbyaceae cyanobacterium C42_A2020_001]
MPQCCPWLQHQGGRWFRSVLERDRIPYFALTSPTLLSQIWARREIESFLAPFSQYWEKG